MHVEVMKVLCVWEYLTSVHTNTVYIVSYVKNYIFNLIHQIRIYCPYITLFQILSRNMLTFIINTFIIYCMAEKSVK